MLDQFQQAFADLVASPGLVSQVCENADLLREKYDLSDREWRRLVSIVNQPGMKCNNVVYRANRITPLLEYLPELCKILTRDLNSLLGEYWSLYTNTNLNFLVDSYRFCEFIQDKIDAGSLDAGTVGPVLERERIKVSKELMSVFCDGDAKRLPDISALFAGAGMKIDLNIFRAL